jgi:hypothetical protein
VHRQPFDDLLDEPGLLFDRSVASLLELAEQAADFLVVVFQQDDRVRCHCALS